MRLKPVIFILAAILSTSAFADINPGWIPLNIQSVSLNTNGDPELVLQAEMPAIGNSLEVRNRMTITTKNFYGDPKIYGLYRIAIGNHGQPNPTPTDIVALHDMHGPSHRKVFTIGKITNERDGSARVELNRGYEFVGYISQYKASFMEKKMNHRQDEQRISIFVKGLDLTR